MDKDKESGALLIAASIIAAIRLKGEPVQPSPKLTAVLKDSISLARLLMAELRK